MGEKDLTVEEVARIARCHRNTVIRYEKIGLIQSKRDRNNFRKFPFQEALRLKEILSLRV
jgi:DNA-binding transcriptional MerR regulator